MRQAKYIAVLTGGGKWGRDLVLGLWRDVDGKAGFGGPVWAEDLETVSGLRGVLTGGGHVRRVDVGRGRFKCHVGIVSEEIFSGALAGLSMAGFTVRAVRSFRRLFY